jgi:predicted RNase H-like HicB family nuclease
MKTREIDYIIWKEDKYFVSRCINVEVSSFGETIEEAINNLKETLELYFESECNLSFLNLGGERKG